MPAAAGHSGQPPPSAAGSPSLRGEKLSPGAPLPRAQLQVGRLEPRALPEPLQDGSSRIPVTLLYLGSLGSTVRKSCWASWKLVTPARISMVFMVARRLVSTSKAKIWLKAETGTQERHEHPARPQGRPQAAPAAPNTGWAELES